MAPGTRLGPVGAYIKSGLVHCNGAIVKVVPIISIKELNKKLILQTGSTNSLRTQPEQLQVYPSISKCYQLIAKICLWTHNSGICCVLWKENNVHKFQQPQIFECVNHSNTIFSMFKSLTKQRFCKNPTPNWRLLEYTFN